MILSQWLATLLGGSLAVQGALAIDLSVDDENSIKSAAKTIATDMIAYYNDRSSKDIPGKFDGTWWEGGSMFMILIQYWFLTGDSQFNDAVQDGMYWQKGDDNYFPSNYSQYLGNDDQVFWGLAAITAAELNYPERDGQPSWVSLAQGVFNTQVPRWDTSSCHGGMRWQIWPFQSGYTTKNAISNGGLFQLAARLALYTKNSTYADWAERIWDWSATTPILKESAWTIADSTTCETQCTDHGDYQWTYNYGTYISGAGYMYNYTNGTVQKYKDGIDGLLGTANQFYPSSGYGIDDGTILVEKTCEPSGKCDRNQITFKAYFASWLAFMTTIVPDTSSKILPKLKTTATAATKTCTGLSDGSHCGIKWYTGSWDGSDGLEQQMAVLGVLNAIMVPFKNQAPYTADTGGTSKSDPNAGTNTSTTIPQQNTVSTGDRAGAGILTVVFVTGWAVAVTWMIRGG
ncbi:CAZyme family GH76 [Penicillium hispanicum]|uniref:CAZyme family GH76 n=1 Tax=Penicillium hispanicum TaxID=1080232 RepID=UPI00253FD307|nr:CAZyme family GH76 [Penicillium hispanicum]KAJ5584743.1 CAZyme family GH76 [Penicillium hispanicum]